MLELSFAVALAILLPPTRSEFRQGVVVEDVGKDSAPDRAGVRAGDVLLGWARSASPPANPLAASGKFRTPIDVEQVEIEEAKRGRITLVGERAGKPISFDLPPYFGSCDFFDQSTSGCYPDLTLRSNMKSPDLDSYSEGRRLIRGKEVVRGTDLWSALADKWSTSGSADQAVWLRMAAGQALVFAHLDGEGQRILDVALTESKASDWNAATKQILSSKAAAYAHTGPTAKKDAALEEIIQISSKEGRPSLWLVSALTRLGAGSYRRGKPAEADSYLRRALKEAEREAPDSIAVSGVLRRLATVEAALGDLQTAELDGRRALAIDRRLVPPADQIPARINLGGVLIDRGKLAEAETLYRETLTLGIDPVEEAFILNNLGQLEQERGNLSEAERDLRRSLELKEKYANGSMEHANALRALGEIAETRGDLAAAEDNYRKALAISRNISDNSDDIARGLTDLGHLALARGDLRAAETDFASALEIEQKVAPGGDAEAEAHTGLGDAAIKKGNLEGARRSYESALTIYEKVAPDTRSCAEALHRLGIVHRNDGELEVSASYFRRAIDALERQSGTLGGTEEVRHQFDASYADFYRDAVDVSVRLNRATEAFNIQEASRARSLLRLLAERDLTFSADVPPALEKERRTVDAEYDRVQDALRDMNPKEDAKKIDDALETLQQLRVRRAGIAEQIRKASARYGLLRYPRALDLNEARSALDPGTLLFSYSIGKERSFLFVVSADPKRGPALSLSTLPIGEKTLRESVEAFRQLIEWNKTSEEATAHARSLYDDLLKPAEARIAKADHLLILPDGPLNTLPWAALVQEVTNGQPQYLVEWKPVDTAVSATVFAELKKERKPPSSNHPVEVAAFGDPKFPKFPETKVAVRRGEAEAEPPTDGTADGLGDLGDLQLQAVVRNGYRLDPLPASRREVEEVTLLYSPKSIAYLGPEATEERAKSIGKDVPIIHFATHAVINERFPLDSALVFTIPEHPKEGQDNGLLQAWEIFEQVRIDADLVTLSACESGLGKEMGGEGLIGLTRAFQYAGARSVLASLWKVEDKATAELMKRFYTYLKSGKTKDEALRSAQIDLIHSKDYSNPRDWAAFQLNGDWK